MIDKTKLKEFFRRIASLTANHDVIDDHACVTANKLGEALKKVDPEWYKDVEPLTDDEYNSLVSTQYELAREKTLAIIAEDVKAVSLVKDAIRSGKINTQSR